MEATKDINRLKVVLAEKKRTNIWLPGQLGKALRLFQSGVQTDFPARIGNVTSNLKSIGSRCERFA